MSKIEKLVHIPGTPGVGLLYLWCICCENVSFNNQVFLVFQSGRFFFCLFFQEEEGTTDIFRKIPMDSVVKESLQSKLSSDVSALCVLLGILHLFLLWRALRS